MPKSFFSVPHSNRYENVVKKMLEEEKEKLKNEGKGCEEDQKLFRKHRAALQEDISSMKARKQGCNMASGNKVQLFSQLKTF